MKMLILGGTGRLGKHLVEQALERGHEVRVLVRNPATLPAFFSKTQVFVGIPADTTVLEQAMSGCDVVISALNISRKNDFPWSPLRTPKDFLSASMGHIITTAQKTGIKHVVLCTAYGVFETKQEIPRWFAWLIDNSNIGVAYADHERAETLLQNSNLPFTIIRPVGLSNSKKQKSIQVTLKGHPSVNLMISRSKVARFMLDEAEKQAYLGKAVGISEA